MVTAGDFRNGVTIEMEGNVYQIIEFQHVKPGKGAAFVRAKLKNIKNGGVVEKTFRPTEKFENIKPEITFNAGWTKDQKEVTITYPQNIQGLKKKLRTSLDDEYIDITNETTETLVNRFKGDTTVEINNGNAKMIVKNNNTTVYAKTMLGENEITGEAREQ